VILIEIRIEETLTAVIPYALVRSASVQSEVPLIERALNEATPNVPELQISALPNEVFQIVLLAAVVRSYQVAKVAMALPNAARFSVRAHFLWEPQCEPVPRFSLAL